MQILITGIAGFVGSSIASNLISSGHQITGIDNFSSGAFYRIKSFAHTINMVVGDIENSLNDDLGDFDAIINCAATAPLPNNEVDHYSSIQNNVATCGAIMQFANRNQINKVIHFSSSAVYEGINNDQFNPLVEDMNLSPKLMYPLSKYLSEQYVATQAEIHQIPTFTLRLFNLYGPNQDYHRTQPPLLGYLFKSLMLSEKAKIYGTKGAKRDYININDLIYFIEKLLTDRPKIGNHEILNVGSGNSYDVFDIISLIQKISGNRLLYETDKPRNFWDKYQETEGKLTRLPADLLEKEVKKVAYANIAKSIMYGLKIETSMESGLIECYKTAKDLFK